MTTKVRFVLPPECLPEPGIQVKINTNPGYEANVEYVHEGPDILVTFTDPTGRAGGTMTLRELPMFYLDLLADRNEIIQMLEAERGVQLPANWPEVD